MAANTTAKGSPPAVAWARIRAASSSAEGPRSRRQGQLLTANERRESVDHRHAGEDRFARGRAGGRVDRAAADLTQFSAKHGRAGITISSARPLQTLACPLADGNPHRAAGERDASLLERQPRRPLKDLHDSYISVEVEHATVANGAGIELDLNVQLVPAPPHYSRTTVRGAAPWIDAPNGTRWEHDSADSPRDDRESSERSRRPRPRHPERGDVARTGGGEKSTVSTSGRLSPPARARVHDRRSRGTSSSGEPVASPERR